MSWIYSDIIHREWACASFSWSQWLRKSGDSVQSGTRVNKNIRLLDSYLFVTVPLLADSPLISLLPCRSFAFSHSWKINGTFPPKSFTQKETWSYSSARQMEANTEGYLQRSMDSAECCNFKQGESCVIYKEIQWGWDYTEWSELYFRPDVTSFLVLRL